MNQSTNIATEEMLPESQLIGKSIALPLFEKYVPDKNSRILDVGCGRGTFLHVLRKNGYSDVYGTDVEQQYDGNFVLCDISADALPHGADFFDAISAWQVFEHLENPHHAARNLHRVLKPGGTLLISMPNPFHLMSRLLFFKNGNMPGWTRKNDHRTLFTKDVFWKIFLKEYFDLVATEYRIGEFTYGPFKHFNGRYPENELFGHFIVWIMRKRTLSQ